MFRKETLLGIVETWETKANETLQGMNTGKLTVVTVLVIATIKISFKTWIFMKYQVKREKFNTKLGAVLY